MRPCGNLPGEYTKAMNIGKQLEFFPRFIEDVPDYSKKKKAWEYLSLTQDMQRARLGELKRLLNEPYFVGRNDGAIKSDIEDLNNAIGFDIATYRQSQFPARGGYKRYIIDYMIDTEKIYQYCKGIVGKNGELLPSRDHQVSKAA